MGSCGVQWTNECGGLVRRMVSMTMVRIRGGVCRIG